MAVPEHLERLKRSVQEWNAWRREQPGIRPDLSSANLNYTNLSLADLSRVNLSGANLSVTNLNESDLNGSDLIEAILSRATIFWANLSNTNLSRAILSEASFYMTDFRRANFRWADFTGADLAGTNFGEANFRWANFAKANFFWTDLTKADFSEVIFYNTSFVGIDLSSVEGLETAIHRSRSIVDINSVTLPTDEYTRKHFLRGIGFSDTFIDYLPSLLTIPIEYYSVFLSYSHYDEAFAKQFYHDLQNNDVRCWFAPHDLCPGTPIVRGIEEAIHLHEKLVLILSADAVNSPWVHQEVEAALYKEVTTGQEILFPIRLDNTVLESDTLWAKRLRQHHIGDFTNWQDNKAYQQAFTTLLRHLKIGKPQNDVK